MMQEPPIPMRAEIISHDVDNHGRKRHHMSQPDIPEFSTGKDFTQERPTKRNRVEGSFPSSLLLGDVGMAAVSAAAAAAAGPSLLQYLSMPTTSTIRPNEPEAFDDGGNDGLDGTSNFQNGAPFFPFFGGQSIAAAANADADAAPRSYHSSVPQTFPNIPSQFACEPVEKNIDKSLDLNENHITFDPEDAIMSAPFCYPHWKEDQDPQHTATITGAGLNRNSPPPSIESTTPRADSYAYSPPSPYSSSEFSGPTEIDFTPGNPSTPATDMTVTATEDITNTSASEDTYAKYASDSADAGVISGLLPTAVDSSSLMLSGEHQFDTDIATPELNDGNAFGYEKGGTSELAFLANLEIPEYQTEQQQEQLNQPSSINAGLVGNFGGIGELDQFKISAADLEALGAIPWTHNQMMIWENQSRPAGPTIPGSDAHSNETDEGKPADGATVETYENNNDDEGFIPDAAIFDEHGSVRGCLPPTLPAGHRHKKFLVVEDTQNGRRMRIKCALENTDIGEIPDSYCKSNAVFPRSWRPRHGPVGDEEFGSEEAGTPTTTSTDDAGSKANSPEEPFTVLPLLHRPKGGRWYKVSDTLGDSASNVISPSLNSNDSNGGNCAYQQVPNGPYPKDDPAEKATNKGVISVFLSNGEWTEFNIPRPRKRRIECALNELGSRMSWAQSRTFSGRPLFLQRALDQYRKRVRSAMAKTGVSMTKETEHFEVRPGKKKWIEKYGFPEPQDQGQTQARTGDNNVEVPESGLGSPANDESSVNPAASQSLPAANHDDDAAAAAAAATSMPDPMQFAVDGGGGDLGHNLDMPLPQGNDYFTNQHDHLNLQPRQTQQPFLHNDTHDKPYAPMANWGHHDTDLIYPFLSMQ